MHELTYYDISSDVHVTHNIKSKALGSTGFEVLLHISILSVEQSSANLCSAETDVITLYLEVVSRVLNK